MATGKSFGTLKDDVSSALVAVTRSAGRVSKEDLAFHRSSNPSLISMLDQQNSRLLRLAQRLTNPNFIGNEVDQPQIQNVEAIEDNWKTLVDIFDNLLEKADACLDEYTGAIRRLSPSQEEQIKKAAPQAGRQRHWGARLQQNFPKPQLLFEEGPANDTLTPFKPLLRSKPHAKVSLAESLVLLQSADGSPQYQHPYETEIRESEYPSTIRAKANPVPYLPYESSLAQWVDTPDALHSMLEELKLASEIAVDLEHHDEHSYIGLVSLMQISTRTKTWVIDTLKPWRRELQILNEVFTNPGIVKVFHGAFMDMVWLQRDFGLYVVGLFDTYHASRLLCYPRNSLAYLLKRFADFDAAKQYQMADWRIRPLPKEMFDYARSDTHFLLFIYDNMRNELIDKSTTTDSSGDQLQLVMNYSKEESLQRYERPLYDSERGTGSMGWYSLIHRTPALFSREQFAVFRAVHQWRDTIARQEDESVHTIMSKQVLYNIAREIPGDMPSLLGCSHPMSAYFQQRKADLLRIVKHAKLEGSVGPDMKEYVERIQASHAEQATGIFKGKPKDPLPAIDRHRSVLTSKEMGTVAVPRVGNSAFWGPYDFPKTLHHHPEGQPYTKSFCLALPLPQLTAEVFRDGINLSKNGISVPRQMAPNAGSNHQHEEKGGAQQEILILRQTTHKRKHSPSHELSKAINSRYDEDGMDTAIDRGNSQADLSKPRNSKESKREKQSERNDTIGGDETQANVTPFDYANAPSVLHAKRASSETGARETSKAENPYAKSINAPKGLRKNKNESGSNRSFTFKR